jgi:hypothetical protein
MEDQRERDCEEHERTNMTNMDNNCILAFRELNVLQFILSVSYCP